jgi:PKD repeat protein
MISIFTTQAIADPVIVAQTGANSDLSNSRQIVRTSTGRIYYLGGNAGHTSNWDGWLEVHASDDGSSWGKESTRDQWYLSSDIGVSIDSRNILHIVSYDWDHRPYYVKYNTADSSTAALTWDGYEPLESSKASDIGKCALAVDANGKPHVVYQTLESYRGKTYYTLTYANRVGTSWSKVAVWPKELKTSFSGKIEIAIGHDNIPYILASNKMLKGNANAATLFETKDLGSAGTSFVIQQNGDIKVAQVSNGNYSIHSHDHASPWSSGWALAESSTPDTGSILLLANDTLYAARLKSDGIWLQKNLDPPFLAASQPANTSWKSLTARWSSNNHSKQGIIDLGTRSWNLQNGNLLWYTANLADSRANFYGGPFLGVAPLTVTLSDSSIPREGSNISSWQWDFENDGTADASGPKESHIYTTPGKYSVSLTITDSSGGQNKIVRPNLIQVDEDSDGDVIPDTRDNCPFDYNPLQIDLNGNGVGDACEPVFNRVATATYMTRLRSITSADSRKSSEVTGIMTDGLLDQKVTLTSLDKNVVSIQLNKDARNIKQLILKFYIDGIDSYNPVTRYVYIMPYKSDLKTTVDSGLSGGWNGWNEADITQLMHRMDGYGVVKFRIAALRQSFNIREITLIEKADDKEISVSPIPVDFGTVTVTKSEEKEISVYNYGTGALNIAKVLAPSHPFSVISDACSGMVLASNDYCNIKTTFAPLVDGQFNDVVVINSDDADRSSVKVALQGTALLNLNGTVRDKATGAPLYHATIAVTDSSRTLTATTDIYGDYSISGVTTGNYIASISRFDHTTQTIEGTIRQGEINRLDALLSGNNGSLSGIVKDPATGLPATGVNVAVTLSGIRTADLTAVCNSYVTVPLTTEDYMKTHENDGNKYSCNNVTFKARNPLGVNEPFTVTWNGIGTMATGTEYLAQKFRPTRTGTLTKVSIDSGWFSSNTFGEVHVILKTSLGGDRGNYIAKSNNNNFSNIRSQTTTWIDFIFPEAPQVLAGADYYIEINGTYFASGDFLGFPTTSIYSLPWLCSDSYPDGKAYQRNSGQWTELATSLAFSTTIDSQPDIVTTPTTTSLSMYGGNGVSVSATLLDPQSGGWNRGISMSNRIVSGSDGQYGYNGDDMTVMERIGDFQPYYDADHWLSVKLASDTNTTNLLFGGTGASALLTDQFAITFERTLTTITDTNGHYSFPDLPSADYNIRFNKPGAYGNASGILAFGEQKQLNLQLTPIPLLAVSITSPVNGTVYGYARTVTISGTVSGNAVVRVNSVAATVSNGIFSANVYISAGANTITATATDQYGQVATTIITVTVPVSANISSISTTDITAGSAVIRWYTDQPATTTVEYGESITYGNSISDLALTTMHSITVPMLKLGTTYHFRVSSTNGYGQKALSGDNTFTTPRFSTTNLGDTGNINTIEITGNFDGKNPDGSQNEQPRKAIAAEYFKTHPDKDFLIFFSTFDYAMPEGEAKGFYTEVKNDTQGINRTMLDNSAQYGSAGMLQGTIDMGNVSVLAANPYGPKLEETLAVLNHELGHRWLAAVRFKNPDGTLNTSLIGRDSAHWSYLLDSKGSIMYGNGWKANGDGTFASTSARNSFSPLDLYLMGMIDKSQVPPMLLIDNSAIDKTQLPQLGATVTGTAKTVTIDDIIAAEGPRIPNATTAQKQFNVGFILLTRPGDNTAAAAQAIETLRKAWTGWFAELTQGKGNIANIPASLEITVDSPFDGATIIGPDVTVIGTVINTSGTETGIMVNGIAAAISGNRFIVNHVPLQEGANTITLTATDANGLTTTTTRSITASPGNYIRISSNIESGTAPLNISLRLDGSFSIANPQVSYSGPVPVTLTPGAISGEYTVMFTVEGTYSFTTSAVGQNNQTYSDTVTITVMSRYQMEALLQGKWAKMKERIIAGDVNGTLASIASRSQTKYGELFTALGAQLPLLNDYLKDIELVYLINGFAKCRLYRNKTIMGAVHNIEYLVNLAQENGIWKVVQF